MHAAFICGIYSVQSFPLVISFIIPHFHHLIIVLIKNKHITMVLSDFFVLPLLIYSNCLFVPLTRRKKSYTKYLLDPKRQNKTRGLEKNNEYDSVIRWWQLYFYQVTIGYKAIYNKKCRGNQIKFNFIIIQASKMKEQVRKILHRIKYVLRATNQTDMEQKCFVFRSWPRNLTFP